MLVRGIFFLRKVMLWGEWRGECRESLSWNVVGFKAFVIFGGACDLW